MGESTRKIICLMPVYNDWESFNQLRQHIAKELQAEAFEIVAVNDGSTEPQPESLPEYCSVIDLKRNVGHQRAIAIGLQYVAAEKTGFTHVVVLDSDGEDRPEDIKAMLEKCEAGNNQKIIFAQRKKRNESLLFKTGYFFYKNSFYFMTGQKINFGNFSCIPAGALTKVALLDNIWNHYSGAIIQSRMPYDRLLLNRGTRYAGKSKMNFNSLILHGLSSIAVYFDVLSLRILRFTLYGIAFCTVSVLYILYQKFFTDNAIPGWASSLILIISGIILQLFSVTLIVLLLQLSSRKNVQPPNAKLYREFIESQP